MRALATSSKLAADRIYNRSGLYLLFGVLIALLGLLFFYLQVAGIPKDGNLTTRLLEMLPRFGVLFFVEFIAFFFLRQYRTAMDEYRHFESIQRQREDNLTVFAIASESDLGFEDRLKLIAASAFNEQAGPLSTASTSGSSEVKRLSRDELALLKKLLDLVGMSKSGG